MKDTKKGRKKTVGLNEVISCAVAYLMENHAPKPLSQGGLAKLSGVSQGTICMNLKGERGWSIDVLEKLCPALGVPLEDLILIGKELQKGGRVFPWPGMLRDTPPASDERLRLIIRAAAGKTTASTFRTRCCSKTTTSARRAASERPWPGRRRTFPSR